VSVSRCDCFEEARVAVVPGRAFGTDDHVRISYAASMKDLENGLDAIQAFIEGLAEIHEA
jgi:aspartate aminotransferase